MLTISSGHSASYLTDAVATGRENYYTNAVATGEPPGRWYGRGAEQLGLSGLVDAQDMTALYEHFVDPRDVRFRCPEQWTEAQRLGHAGRRYATEDQIFAAALDKEPAASGERRAELRVEAGKKARKNVAFLDATFSVQKSVTVLHTAFEAQEVAARAAGDAKAAEAWAAHRTAVEDAIWAGNQAAMEYLSQHAGYSRVGHHGGAAGRFIDAHDWVVASFFQHDSRDRDPQLHIHNAVLNRVQGSDGVWRTLDSKAIHKFRGAAAAVGERTTEEHLARSLGVRFAMRPDGKAREIVGVAQWVMDLFSSRRRAITQKSADLVAAFETKFGREPSSLELDRLQRQATFATRIAKSHGGESFEQRLVRWNRELSAEVDGGLATVAADVLELAGAQRPAEPFNPAVVIETALADVQSRHARWTAGELTRAINDALPDHLGELAGEDLAALLHGLTAKGLELAVPLDAPRPGDPVLPDDLKLQDGRSAYEAPGGRRYATPEHLRTERALLDAAHHGTAAALPLHSAKEFLNGLGEIGIELGADQQAAVRGILTSGAAVETLVGPAGTGKSFVVGTLAKAWTDPGLWADGQPRRVVGLAASQIATDVLAAEGLEARNITRWLATQDRLTDGTPQGDDAQWRLQHGDLVVVDESAMANTGDLAAIHQHCQNAGAKLLLVGDHRQLAAVGAGGAMNLLATAGSSHELAEARRFSQPWERDASLRLRAGDEAVLEDYHKHGRLIDAGTLDQAETSAARAWLADTLHGQRSVLLVDTNEAAARLSAQLRAELVRLGRVDDARTAALDLQGTHAGAGDLVQARANAWNLTGYHGNTRPPINRETYRVRHVGADGGLVVAPILGRDTGTEVLGDPMILPPAYVAEHLALGYATTVHSAQGLTVDTSHVVVSPATGPSALYVGLSRGREANHAHVTTRSVPPDAPTGAVRDAVHRNPRATLAGAFESAVPDASALATATESAQDAQSVRTAAELLADASEIATAGRTAGWLDELVGDGLLSPDQRITIAAEVGARTLNTLLRRVELAGHDPHQALIDAVEGRQLHDARHFTNVIHHRITHAVSVDPVGDRFTHWVPAVSDPGWQRYLDTLAARADQRQTELGAQLAADPQPWTLEALGPVPTDDLERGEWEQKAGIVAAHRELTDHDDPLEPLGPAPTPGQVEHYASWRASWRALDRPEADRDELEMSDGQLHLRVRAYEREKAWAPAYVAGQLAGTHQAAEHARHTATLRATEATTADGIERDRLAQEAADAAELAELLDHQATQLHTADEARALWLAHTAETRAAADRATAELSARHADQPPEREVTAEEWLAAHDAATRDEDAHRAITAEHDLTDLDHHRGPDRRLADELATETSMHDLRDTEIDPALQLEDDTVRVPTAAETADVIARAQRALSEIAARHQADSLRLVEERAAQTARWAAADQELVAQAGQELSR